MRKTAKCLIKAMDTVNVEINKAMEFEELKKQNSQCKIQAMTMHVKFSEDKELVSFAHHLRYSTFAAS